MTHQAWYCSDHHFGHTATWAKFLKPDGTPLRPFSSTEEMDEHMVEEHNKLVHDRDTVYLLGDLVINRRNMHIIQRLKGHKKLVRGNHDIFHTQEYLDVGIEEIYGVYVDVKRGWICSHIPLHVESLARWQRNVHGHLHANRVMKMHADVKTDKIDPRYLSVCMEQIDFRPINADEVAERFVAQGG